MKTTIAAILVFVLSLSLGADESQNNQGTPRQQYSAIFKQYSPVSGGLWGAKSDEDRKARVERLAAFSSRFLDLAARHPEDPIALRAIRQAVQIVVTADSAAQKAWEISRSNFPAGCSDGSAARTVELVLRNHIRSDKLGPVLDRMRYGFRLEYEKCLSTVLEKNPHHEIQALACLTLAQFLYDKLRMYRLVEDRPELSECYKIVFGKDYLPKLQRLARAELTARIETLFERAANEYADVKFRDSTVGAWAKSELYDIRHLGVGKVAPDIEGKDQEGTKFKLSDYRGKVVLLYFWLES